MSYMPAPGRSQGELEGGGEHIISFFKAASVKALDHDLGRMDRVLSARYLAVTNSQSQIETSR
jgi:hypothetical protein